MSQHIFWCSFHKAMISLLRGHCTLSLDSVNGKVFPCLQLDICPSLKTYPKHLVLQETLFVFCPVLVMYSVSVTVILYTYFYST